MKNEEIFKKNQKNFTKVTQVEHSLSYYIGVNDKRRRGLG